MFSIEDIELIRLYQGGSEDAIEASERKYGAYCRKIAMNVLGDAEDAGECVNDVWLKAWNGIPHAAPPNLQAHFANRLREHNGDQLRRARNPLGDLYEAFLLLFGKLDLNIDAVSAVALHPVRPALSFR